DGIEVTNGKDFYPEIVNRAVEKKLYMVSATDIHASTASIYGKQKFYRDMTLIFAKDKSEASLRKAFLSQKTLGYCGGYIIGEKSLLEKFFRASVTVVPAGTTKKGLRVSITNNTSFDYTLNDNGRIVTLPAFHTVSATLTGDKAIYTVENMIHTSNQRLVVEFKLAK
ncbi:MAG: histidinol-phosphatase, partial [Alistipes sp.]|nr:histidinol-phosphatase [Alistipes sp.]